MAEAYYEPTPATDGATMNPVPGAVFQVFEIADTTFTTPLSLRVGSGNPTTTVTASDTLATLPGVYVTSDNFEHIWKSGTFEWRRDSITGAKLAIDAAKQSASDSAAASEVSKQAAVDAANLVAAPADTAVSALFTDPATQTRIQGDALYSKRREVNVLDHGAKGDWNGTTGTDNRAAFNAAVAEAVSTGKPSKIVIPDGDYWLSNNWLIDGENIEVECGTETTIRTTAATTTGATVTFMGNGVLSPNDVNTPQRERFTWRGGKVIATGSGTADNALGIVRVKNCHVSDVTLDADRKGLTAQYGIDNIVWERVVVTRAGTDAVTVETLCRRVSLRDVHVVSTAGVGVLITSGKVGERCADVLLDNVNVDSCATGVSLGLSDRVSIRKTRVGTATTQGLYVAEVADLSISGDSAFPSVNIGANVTYKKPRRQVVTLGNSWVAFGEPHDALVAYRTGGGMIVLDGAIKNGTTTAGTVFGTLPLGARPAKRTRFLAQNAGAGSTGLVDVYVEPNGQMIFPIAVPSNVIVSLSGTIFPSA